MVLATAAMAVLAADGGADWIDPSPARAPLFFILPRPADDLDGVVLPEFASLEALAHSSTEVLTHLTADERSWLQQLASLELEPKAELADITASAVPSRDARVPADFVRLRDVRLQPAMKPRTLRALADGEDIGLRRVFPVRVHREKGAVRALALRWETHFSRDAHDLVTEENAAEHTVTHELLRFDAQGRLVARLRFSRSDNENRYLPGIDLQAWTFTWSKNELVEVCGLLVEEDSDRFDLLVRRERRVLAQ